MQDEEAAARDASNVDSSSFNVAVAASEILATRPLPDLLNYAATLGADTRALDREMQDLVYNNYNRRGGAGGEGAWNGGEGRMERGAAGPRTAERSGGRDNGRHSTTALPSRVRCARCDASGGEAAACCIILLLRRSRPAHARGGGSRGR